MLNVLDRFESKIMPEPNSGCWLWLGWITPKGYGKFAYQNRMIRAHRFSYSFFIGPIPAGLTLDHLCRVRSCVNPHHLEPVAVKTNVLRGIGLAAINARKTHCKRGHLLEGNNIIWHRRWRSCRSCRTIWMKEHEESHKNQRREYRKMKRQLLSNSASP